MPQVFISYSKENAVFADLTMFKLDAEGINVWLDAGDLRGGEEWRSSIDKGIAQSDAMIVILTPASSASAYVTYEWGFALGMNKRVIPILQEDCEVHPRLEAIHYLDFRDHRSAPWDALASQIKDAEGQSSEGPKEPLVGQMRPNDLQEIIANAIALASTTGRASAREFKPEALSLGVRGADDDVSRSSRQDSARQPRTILWVDDRPNKNIYEREAFEALGIQFALALSTGEALELLEQRRFSAIISNMSRKEGPREGYSLLESLRETDTETPFFVYAGSNALNHKREAEERGAQGSTNNPQELFNLVARYLD